MVRTLRNPALEVERRGRGHVLDDLAENVEGGRVGGGGFALCGLDHDGHSVGQVVAEGAPLPTEVGSDLLLEVRRRDQTAGPEDRAPFAQVVNVGGGQPRRRAPERVPVGAILVSVKDKKLQELMAQGHCQSSS